METYHQTNKISGNRTNQRQMTRDTTRVEEREKSEGKIAISKTKL